MSGIPTTAELQALTRPVLDQVFAAVGQTITVLPPVAGAGDGPPPGSVDADGNYIPASGTPSPDPTGPSFPCFAYPVSAADRLTYGAPAADLNVPLWDVLIHWTADLDKPGFRLRATGGALTTPLDLTPVADAEDLGTQRICWRVLCRASRALEG